MAITTIELDALKPKENPYIIREKQLNKKDGTLAFKKLPNGNIDGYFIYYVDGKEKLKKIGRYGSSRSMMSLKQIRDAYIELSKKYYSGIDVKVQELEMEAAQERDRREQAITEYKEKMQGSFQQLIDLYVEHAKENLSVNYYQTIKCSFALNLKDFNTKIKANEVTSSDIRKILKPIKERNALVMANRMRAYLSAAFEWIIELESDDDEEDDSYRSTTFDVQFFIKINPVIGVKKPLKKELPSDRFLNEAEVHEFWQALSNSKMSIHRKNILKLMLVLGSRIEALAALRWSEVDLNSRLIEIPPLHSKNKLYWVIPMNDIACEIIANNPRLHDELVFISEYNDKTFKADGINQATKRLCKQANIAPFNPRDLRTTFKTLTGKAGLPKDIRDRLQNHAMTDVSSLHYDRYDYLPQKREAMREWNEYLKPIIQSDYLDKQKLKAIEISLIES